MSIGQQGLVPRRRHDNELVFVKQVGREPWEVQNRLLFWTYGLRFLAVT